MATPLPLLDLINSLRLEGIPTRAAPGDRISPRVVPDLSPRPGGLPNLTLEALTRGEMLAEIVADLAPILNYIAQTLGIDTAAVLKAVEFDKPVEARADQVDVSSPSVRDLPHLVPVGAPPNILQISQLVEGLIARAKGKLDFEPGELPSQVTALIRKPAVLAALPVVTLQFRVVDEAGNPLVSGRDFFASLAQPFAPEFVLLPAVVDTSGNPPLSVRRSFFCDVTVDYTPVGGAPERIRRTLGPIPLDLATTAVPLIAVLTEHAIGDGRFPGRVFVGVPGNSNLGDASVAFDSLAQIRSALGNIVTVLGLIGIAVPGPLAAAISAINTVTGLAVGRFRKGDLIGFFEWRFGIPPWDDWQNIFSAVFLFGPPSRRAFLGGIIGGLRGFDVLPSPLGVAAIPDLSVFPLAPTVGTARQLFPAPPAAPPGGSFNDNATSINFPVP